MWTSPRCSENQANVRKRPTVSYKIPGFQSNRYLQLRIAHPGKCDFSEVGTNFAPFKVGKFRTDDYTKKHLDIP